MSAVVQLRRQLAERPDLPSVPGVELRNYGGAADIDAWLDIRHAAFARQSLGVRQWTRADFEVEILAKPWWSESRLWFAEVASPAGECQAVGTITMALRAGQDVELPAVHWLAVRPAWRRLGIARLLLTRLEQSAWDLGYRQVCLETHSAWIAARGLYDACGYEP